MSRRSVATFFGGVVPASTDEQLLAYEAGRALGQAGFALQHGGYNGLMEDAARGAASVGADVVAVTLAGKEEWGAFNPYVTDSFHAPEMGGRLLRLLDRAEIVVGMGGGVGSLHELTAAIWYAGNVRPVPVIILGSTACRLLDFLKQERWVYESPTRPIDFLHTARTLDEFERVFANLPQPASSSLGHAPALADRIRQVAFVRGSYQLADGRMLSDYFDPFRLAADPMLSAEVAKAMAQQLSSLPDVVVGLALGGVPLAANLAQALNRPLLIARARPKEYGTFAQLEGFATRGHRALLVDDVVRSGRQMLATLGLLEQSELSAHEAVCVVSRKGKGVGLLHERDVILHAVLTEPHFDEDADAHRVDGVVR